MDLGGIAEWIKASKGRQPSQPKALAKLRRLLVQQRSLDWSEAADAVAALVSKGFVAVQAGSDSDSGSDAGKSSTKERVVVLKTTATSPPPRLGGMPSASASSSSESESDGEAGRKRGRRSRTPSPAPPSPFVVPEAPKPHLLSALRGALQPLPSPARRRGVSQVTDVTFDATPLRVTYTSDPEVARVWLHKYYPATSSKPGPAAKFIGMDAEWKPSFRKGAPDNPVALLQLASVTGAVLLLHLCRMSGGVPSCVQDLLQSKRVHKVGVGVLEDARKLYRDFGAVTNAIVDVGDVARKHNAVPDGRYSLLAVATHYLKCSSWKSKRVTMSNWEMFPLSAAQQRYAAIDSYVGAAIYRSQDLDADDIAPFVCGASAVTALSPQLRGPRRRKSPLTRKPAAFTVHLEFEATPAPVAPVLAAVNTAPLVQPVAESSRGAAKPHKVREKKEKKEKKETKEKKGRLVTVVKVEKKAKKEKKKKAAVAAPPPPPPVKAKKKKTKKHKRDGGEASASKRRRAAS